MDFSSLIGSGNPTDIKNAGNSSGGKIAQSALPAIGNFLKGLLGGVDKTADWKGWDNSDVNEWHSYAGQSVVMYLLRSDDDNRRSAINIINYLANRGDVAWMIGKQWEGGYITPDVIRAKFNRAGLSAEGEQLAQQYQLAIDQKNALLNTSVAPILPTVLPTVSQPVNTPFGVSVTPAVPAPSTTVPTATPNVNQASMLPAGAGKLLTYLLPVVVLAGLVFTFITGGKPKYKRRY